MTDEPTRVDWYSTDDIRPEWRDAPSNDPVLLQLLTVAKQQVLEFDQGYQWRLNPANSETAWPGDYDSVDVPEPLRLAQKMQARNLYNANRVDPSNGSLGDSDFTVRPFPLDWVVKQVIRPKRAVPRFG